ncbi:MAG: nucleotide exchange factor GrpE [Candidatus Cloacimonetes bacterium]|nr:nucleotide exchange factor GrpE [Candidatus Cloacimonadota bacterium]
MATQKKKIDKISDEIKEQKPQDTEQVKKEENLIDKEQELVKRIAELEKECAEWKDKYLRCIAEFENYRRRSNEEKADWIKMATQRFALEICEVADNFERALNQVSEEKKDDSFVKGMMMIAEQLKKVMEKEGITKIDALGKPFDPAIHDALAHIPSEYDENTIAAVIQNGYMLYDKLLRPVRVAVSSGKIENKSEESETMDNNEVQDASSEDSNDIKIEIKD